MTQPALDPGDAPFGTTSIPTGWDRPLTQAEADAANVLYPVPPYGASYEPPGPPVPPPFVPNSVFVKVDNIVSAGATTTGTCSRPDLMHENLIFVLWPIAGVLGIVDDVGARPVRVLTVDGANITFNFDSGGLDVTGLVLLGVVYTGD